MERGRTIGVLLALTIGIGVYGLPNNAFADQGNDVSTTSQALPVSSTQATNTILEPVQLVQQPETLIDTKPINPVPQVINQSNLQTASDNSQAPPNSTQTQTPARRIPETGVDSLPFPSGEWGIGGTSPIGAPDTSPQYPLMRALSHTEFGQWLEQNRIKLYGWTSVGGNLSTSAHNNFPEVYAYYPNRVELDQLVFNAERIPDTVQRDHVDWGFRLSPFYGTDYRSTFAEGLFSSQYLDKHRQYGFDPVLMYFDLYIPKVAQGMNIRIGRFLSIPDIEAQLAPDNYMFTHSLMYGIDIYTSTGVLTSTRLNKNWTFQAGLVDGNDIMPWKEGSHPTGLGGIQWISNSGHDCIYLVADSINTGNYAYNNVQEYVGTWSHTINKRWHTKTEAWYMWENHVPGDTLPSTVLGPGQEYAFTNEWAIVNYLEYKISPKDYLTIRNEYMDDAQGQRTGYATAYTSHGIGWVHWFTNWLAFRPEIRYEHAYDQPAYDNGNKRSQFMLAGDVITRF